MKTALLKIVLLFSFLTFGLHAHADAIKDYKKELKKHTRHGENYRKSDLAATIIWDATILNADMTQAQAKLYAHQYDLNSSEFSDKWEQLSQESKGQVAFFITFFTNEKKFNDLSNENHGWQLMLINGAQKVRPQNIEKFKRLNPEQVLYYPHAIAWSTGYKAVFPIASSELEPSFKLELRHTKSQSTLEF